MSQVVVTQDKLSEKRQKSLAQERSIKSEAMFAKWLLSDTSKPDPIAKLVGIATLPVVALWGLIAGAAGLMFAIATMLFKVIGKVAGNRKSGF